MSGSWEIYWYPESEPNRKSRISGVSSVPDQLQGERFLRNLKVSVIGTKTKISSIRDFFGSEYR
ncbi:unnamed protein product [Meloidogyne enterolobii]|uniref:Uncharacterized protein n=1 Tax=Meloidogyne enterolobii TaxID=390850 RepID=A0ACB1A7D2_MELEN